MKNNDPFEIIRSLPAELERQEVQPLLQELPVLAAQATGFSNLFFKKIFFLGLPIVGLLSLLLIEQTPGPEKEATPTGQTTLSMLTPGGGLDLGFIVEEIPTPVFEKEPLTKTNLGKAGSSSPAYKPESLAAVNRISLKPLETATGRFTQEWPEPKFTLQQDQETSLSFRNKERQQSSFTVAIKWPDVPTRFESIKLGKLKRMLRKNLHKDGLIRSKSDAIDMELPGEEIRLNGQELTPDLYQKYTRLLDEFAIGTGPDRRIKITTEFVAVGDFYPEGFSGSAKGTFESNFLSSDSLSNANGLFEK